MRSSFSNWCLFICQNIVWKYHVGIMCVCVCVRQKSCQVPGPASFYTQHINCEFGRWISSSFSRSVSKEGNMVIFLINDVLSLWNYFSFGVLHVCSMWWLFALKTDFEIQQTVILSNPYNLNSTFEGINSTTYSFLPNFHECICVSWGSLVIVMLCQMCQLE